MPRDVPCGRLEFPQGNLVLAQESGGDPDSAVHRTGWAAGLENYFSYLLEAGQQENLLGTTNKGQGDIFAILGDDPGSTGQDGITIATNQVGRGSGGCHAAQLFRAAGNINFIAKIGQALRTGFRLARIAGAESHQAGAD